MVHILIIRFAKILYWLLISRLKVTKFSPGVENFKRRKILANEKNVLADEYFYPAKFLPKLFFFLKSKLAV